MALDFRHAMILKGIMHVSTEVCIKSTVIADAKKGCAGDSTITPYNLVIFMATLTAKHAEIAR
jgi:hypothetical protein